MWFIIYTFNIDYYFNLNGNNSIDSISATDLSNPRVIAFIPQVETEVVSSDVIIGVAA